MKQGSIQEWKYIDYVDKHISRMQRRFDKHGLLRQDAQEADAAQAATARQAERDLKGVDGYTSFREVGKDVESLIDVVWVSATPHLQVAHLLNLTSLITSALPAFAPAPHTMFRVLGKLDLAFASLITGRDLDNGVPLPGFEIMGSGVSGTEKVRIKSLVQRGRLTVSKLMDSGEEFDKDDVSEGQTEMDAEDNAMDLDDDADYEYDDWGVEMSHVFERTIIELGDDLNAAPVGLLIDDNPIYKKAGT